MKKFLLAGAFAALALFPAAAQDASSDFEALAGSASDDTAPAASLGTLQWSGDQEFAWRFGAADNPTRTGGSVDGTLAGEYRLGDLKVVGAASVRNNEFVTGETAAFYSVGPVKLGAGYQEFSWGLADAKNPTDTLNARDYRYGANAPRLVNPAATIALYPADWLSVEAVFEPWKEMSTFPKDFQKFTQKGLVDAASVMGAKFASQIAAYTKAASDATDAATATLTSNGGNTSDPVYVGLATAAGQATVAKNLTIDLATKAAGYSPVVTAETVTRDLSNPVFGGRANFFLPGVDLSLSYLYDRDTYYTPVVTMTSVTGSTTTPAPASATIWMPNQINLVLKRIHRLGVNAKTTVDRFGLWMETAYNLTEDPAGTDDSLRNNKLSWTTGLDFNFGPSSAYYLNVQYAGEWVLGYDAATLKDYKADPTASQMADQAYMTKRTYRSLVQSLGSESEELMNTLTASVKFPLEDNLVTPSLSGAVIVPTNYDDTVQTRVASAFFKPEIDVMPADGVHILFGADLAYGWVKKAGSSDITQDTATDKLGVYTPQNNLYIKVQYKWNGSLGN